MASPSSTPQLVRLFLEAATPRLAYHPDLKEVFHQCGKALLRRIAGDVDYGKCSYDLRSNKALTQHSCHQPPSHPAEL